MSNIFDSDYKVLMVAQEGYDVNTATPEQFIIHSGFAYHGVPNLLEGYESYTTPSTISSGLTIAKEITHNLGYVPDFHIFIEEVDVDTDTFAQLPYSYISTSFSIIAKADAEKVYIILKNIGGDITSGFTDRDYGFRYQIFNTGGVPQ